MASGFSRSGAIFLSELLMADDLIHCPSCGFQLRLPTDLYGSAVECPQCHSRFTAPAPAARPMADRPPPGREYDAVVSADGGGHDYLPPERGNPLMAPAIALLIVSLSATCFTAYGTLVWLTLQHDQVQFDAMMDQAIDKNPQIQPQDRARARQMMIQFRDQIPIICGVLSAINIVTVLGAVMMLARKAYWLAMIGCICALNPVNIPCCLLQLPFGIWGLIALLGESGRRAYR
jgi:hypothetical protein